VVLTGAGVSAESGVPTFRGPGGLWKSRRPEDLATPAAFARDPRLVWEWYAWRRSVVASCAPNAAHLALARLALRHADTLIVTQNVDGLHHRAAAAAHSTERLDPDRAYPLEVHGAIHRDRCSACGRRTPGGTVDATDEATLPRCGACGGLLRPDVVWFGESLDPDVLARAFEAAARADVCLVVGTSSVVYPAAAVPEVTLAGGGAVVEVNPDVTPLSPRAAVSVRAAAAEVVPRLID
jgi:NAD-dependent deacetylase